MEFQKLIETRRTVRKYAADSEVTREQMETLIHAAQEAPSWKNSQTGRYYCVLSREIVDKIRATCLPGAGNAGKSENAALIVTTFVHDRAGFQKDGTADNELITVTGRIGYFPKRIRDMKMPKIPMETRKSLSKSEMLIWAPMITAALTSKMRV